MDQTLNLPEQELKRCAILGTAPTWKMCPWGDRGLHIFGLNDAHVLGYPRVDAWWDLHPPSHWFFYDKAHPPTADQVPVGTYLRPVGHKDWIKHAGIPVFLHEARADWPTTVTFPKDKVLDFWKPYWPLRMDRKGVISEGKDYEASSPAWMYMWAVMEGYREIGIYGIHLATEWEYLQQRPNLEFLMGVGAGLGVKHIIPARAPICQGTFQYGYEPKTDTAMEPAQRRIAQLKHELRVNSSNAAGLAWYAVGAKADLAARRSQIEVELMDAQMELAHVRTRVG